MPGWRVGRGDSDALIASSGQRIRWASSTVRGGSSGGAAGAGGESNTACRGVVGDPMPVDRDVEVGVPVRALGDRKSTRLNSSHSGEARMPSSA